MFLTSISKNDTDVRNIPAKLQVSTFRSFFIQGPFKNCSGEQNQEFGLILKYTINVEIGNLQIAISRARNNIFGRIKKRLDPYIHDLHISKVFLPVEPPYHDIDPIKF